MRTWRLKTVLAIRRLKHANKNKDKTIADQTEYVKTLQKTIENLKHHNKQYADELATMTHYVKNHACTTCGGDVHCETCGY